VANIPRFIPATKRFVELARRPVRKDEIFCDYTSGGKALAFDEMRCFVCVLIEHSGSRYFCSGFCLIFSTFFLCLHIASYRCRCLWPAEASMQIAGHVVR